PKTDRYRRVQTGTDVPQEFVDNLKQIDRHLYLVWHKYRTLWDTIINDYAGPTEDPRYEINREWEGLNFGFVLTNGDGAPILEEAIHIWRHCPDVGWAHIMKLEAREPDYLRLVIEKLHLQAKWTDKYGFISYNRLMTELDEAKQEIAKNDAEHMFESVQKENEWLTRKAAENFARGKVKPTNPMKEIITNITPKKIIRPLTDTEAGLIVPDSW
ncbi:unnamed protein product, partial [marine sediment metagenome]